MHAGTDVSQILVCPLIFATYTHTHTDTHTHRHTHTGISADIVSIKLKVGGVFVILIFARGGGVSDFVKSG